jgi:hypothetical protein
MVTTNKADFDTVVERLVEYADKCMDKALILVESQDTYDTGEGRRPNLSAVYATAAANMLMAARDLRKS